MGRKLTAILSYLLIFAMLITTASINGLAETKDWSVTDEVTEDTFEDTDSVSADEDGENTGAGDEEDPAEDDIVDEETEEEAPEGIENIGTKEEMPGDSGDVDSEETVEEVAEETSEGSDREDELSGEAIEPVGYVYVEESSYTITFEGLKNGQVITDSYVNDVTSETGIIGLMADNHKELLNPDSLFYKNLVGGNNTVRGWDLYTNGSFTKHLDAHFSEENEQEFKIAPKQDYHFRAEQWQRVSEKIVVDAVSAVYYDGRSHVSSDEKLSAKDKKKKANDLNIRVSYLPAGPEVHYGDEAQEFLRLGKDYKITYKNNKNASLEWFRLASRSLPFDDKPVSAQKLIPAGNCKVAISDNIEEESIGSTTDGNYRHFNYGIDWDNYLNMPADYVKGVFIFREKDKLPGTYKMSIYPYGPGVDHDFVLNLKYRRTAISTENAVKKGLLKVTPHTAFYNAGGSLPSGLQILFNGEPNQIGLSEFKFSGQAFPIKDMDEIETTVRIYAKNNKKPRKKPYLVLEGDGYIFKGKSKTKFNYSMYAKTSISTIRVINARNYTLSHGAHTNTLSDKTYSAGELYAMMTPIFRDKKKLDSEGRPKNPKITLYQAYYRNAAEYNEGRLSLAKISSKQYDMFLTKQDDHAFLVTVQNKPGKLIEETKYGFSPATLKDNADNVAPYTIYDKDVKIKSVTFMMDDLTTTYEFPKDKNVSFTFTGDEFRFPYIYTATLSNGVTVTGDSLRTEYKDNVRTGTATVTVYLKKSGTSFPYGGSGKFTFRIKKVDDKTL
ncbi:MAG: hypothetical protein K6F53_01845 [Lachnospiraceae bacterium]|nr:hypothetical protein [Lachnospiraceae bacterium]